MYAEVGFRLRRLCGRRHRLGAIPATLALALAFFGGAATDGGRLEARSDSQDSLARLTALVRKTPPGEPWRRDVLERRNLPAVRVDATRVLAFLPDAPELAGARLGVAGGYDFSLELLQHDPALGLALFRIEGAEAAGREARDPLAAFARAAFAQGFGYREGGQSLRLQGVSGTEESTVVGAEQSALFEGVGRMESAPGATPLAALRFSLPAGEARPGDLLWDGSNARSRKLLGIVINYRTDQRQGEALGAVYLQAFLERAEANAGALRKGELELIEWRDARESRRERMQRVSHTVVHPGFRGTALASDRERRYLGVPADSGGFLVEQVFPWLRPVRDRILPGDVIIAVNGKPLADGAVASNAAYGELPLELALTLDGPKPRAPGDRASLTLIRQGERIETSIELHPYDEGAMRVPLRFRRPDFFIAGGLLFTELSREYLQSRPGHSRLEYLARYNDVGEFREARRYVVLDRIFPLPQNRAYQASGNAGYDLAGGHSLEGELVLSVNGVAVRSLVHLRALVRERMEDREDLAFGLTGGRLIVIGYDELRAADAALRERHGIGRLDSFAD